MIKVNLDMKNINKRFLRVKNSITRDAYTDTIQYIPYDTGALTRSRKVRENRISWNRPYARYVWEGVNLFNGRPLRYQRHVHARAGKEWFNRSKADNIDKWLERARKEF